jgi:hypothetical protein
MQCTEELTVLCQVCTKHHCLCHVQKNWLLYAMCVRNTTVYVMYRRIDCVMPCVYETPLFMPCTEEIRVFMPCVYKTPLCMPCTEEIPVFMPCVYWNNFLFMWKGRLIDRCLTPTLAVLYLYIVALWKVGEPNNLNVFWSK